MNELLLEILPDIDNIIRGVTKVPDDQNEIKQELILKIYDNEKKVRQLKNQGKLNGWLFIVARNLFTDFKRNQKRTVTGSDIRLYSDEDFKIGEYSNKNRNIEDMFSKILYNLPKDEEHYKPNLKTWHDMYYQLSEIERLWIETYINCNFNYSEIQRRTNIDRRHAKARIQTVLKKWKHLDIYLPQ